MSTRNFNQDKLELTKHTGTQCLWSDYTYAKHFGSGIFRPYSDFVADVLLDLDSRLASEPAFARSIIPYPSRDTILVLGESVAILAISAGSHRHYPLLATYKWSEFRSANEPELVARLGLSGTLSAIGFQPWLDEDKMKAGANLERAIREGFTTSCAAVFFVTPNFADDGFLATEIDYALAEKRDKVDRFAIITLLLRGADGTFGTVPQMIRQYVWRQVEPMEVTRTIVESLPIRMERVVWRQ